MRFTPLLPLIAAALALTACDGADHKTTAHAVTINKGDKSVSGISIDSDDFKANIEIPGVEFNGEKMDIDGMKLPEGSRVKSMRVRATDKDGVKNGTVTFDFTAPMAPDAVASQLEAQAKDSDWGAVTRSTASDGAIVLAASKSDDGKETLEYRLTADGSGTRGSATIVGDKH